MKLEKCPVCAKRLKESSGRMICPECGYYQIIDKNAASAQPTPPVSPRPNSAPQNVGPVTSTRFYPGAAPRPITVSKGNKKIGTMTYVNIGILSVLVLIFLGGLLTAFLSADQTTESEEAIAAPTETVDTADDSYPAHPQQPASEFFQSLVSKIYEKDYTQVSAEELDRITELSFYYDEDNRKCIYCALDDGMEHWFYIDGDFYTEFADLSCFRGVTTLSIEYGNIYPGDLDGMESLVHIASDMTLDDLCEIVPHPEKMESIQIYSTIFMDSCDGIENFPNLKSFSAEGSSLSDISGLMALSGLESLFLVDCDHIKDFSPLYKLDSLQALSIDSMALKDIGFVANMPDLYYLDIIGAQDLISIDAVSSRADTMEYFYLEDTWELNDLTIIETLTNLVELQFGVTYEDTMPSLAGMENLQYLNITGAGDLASLAEAKSLIGLTLDRCNCEDLSFLSQMQNLAFLELLDMSGYYISFEPVTSLPKLQYLSINESTAYADAAVLLGIPTLTEFYMEDCTIGFNVDQVVTNENLAILNMNHVSLHPISSGEYGSLHDTEELTLANHTDLFSRFPNLQELYLESAYLEDLSFVSQNNLMYLEVLDIADNYVTDLSPLADLGYLHTVFCEDNPIADTAGLDDLLVR